jgi:hypothetical protein
LACGAFVCALAACYWEIVRRTVKTVKISTTITCLTCSITKQTHATRIISPGNTPPLTLPIQQEKAGITGITQIIRTGYTANLITANAGTVALFSMHIIAPTGITAGPTHKEISNKIEPSNTFSTVSSRITSKTWDKTWSTYPRTWVCFVLALVTTGICAELIVVQVPYWGVACCADWCCCGCACFAVL